MPLRLEQAAEWIVLLTEWKVWFLTDEITLLIWKETFSWVPLDAPKRLHLFPPVALCLPKVAPALALDLELELASGATGLLLSLIHI